MTERPSRIDLVKAWFRGHIDSEAGQAFVTDDMAFRMPPSGVRDLTMGLPWAGRDSLRRLGILDRALYATYGQMDNNATGNFRLEASSRTVALPVANGVDTRAITAGITHRF